MRFSGAIPKTDVLVVDVLKTEQSTKLLRSPTSACAGLARILLDSTDISSYSVVS